MSTKIEWTERVWNPVTGCTKVSESCRNCYAETMARRLQHMPASKDKYRNGFQVTCHPEALIEPMHWKKPSMIFVCSMGDLFHADVPEDFIIQVMEMITACPQHTFQILTKRPDRMAAFFKGLYPPRNIWIGTTCESRDHYDRIRHLQSITNRRIPVRFVSCEPLLGDMPDIPLDGIDWLITGGESGSKARQTPPDYFRHLRDRCQATNTPFFFKQWGAYGPDGVKRSKYDNGSLLDGTYHHAYPTTARPQSNAQSYSVDPSELDSLNVREMLSGKPRKYDRSRPLSEQ